MARRITRPMALRITWLISPYGISAHCITATAWLVSFCAAAGFAMGTTYGWLAGALLLQLWYLLDHVDGQIARLRGTASLDGVQLDYLMHHCVQAVIPASIGWGLCFQLDQPVWLLAGLAWGGGAALLGLLHDARYKAFVQRLKRVEGELLVIGGGGARPQPPQTLPSGWLRRGMYFARKSVEPHVTMNILTVLAFAAVLFESMQGSTASIWVMATYVSGMGILSPLLFVVTLARSLSQQAAEREFKAWYVPPPGTSLTFRDGWWLVEPLPSGHSAISDSSDGTRPLTGRSS